MKQHFVRFLSPGTFFNEEECQPIEEWNVDAAVEMARSIVARYNAKPFAFEFYTKARTDEELDSKIVATSSRYYLGGFIETLEQIEQRAASDEEILLRNMRSGNWSKIITNNNSWKITQPFKDDDVLLDVVL